jgi:hypothetical protein
MIAQRLDVEIATTQGVIHCAVSAAMFGDQAAHRAVGARQRLGQLE